MNAFVERLVPPANRAVSGWHVSPFIDLAAYQFSWVWILVPLALLGDLHPKDYLFLWAFGRTFSFLHRQYTMPYVYLDRQVFAQHVTRFTLFFGWLVLGFLSSVFIFRWTSPKRFFLPIDAALVVAGAVVVAQSLFAEKRQHPFTPPVLAALGAPFAIAVVLGLTGVFVPYHMAVASFTLVGLTAASIFAAREVRSSPVEEARKAAWIFPLLVTVIAVAGLTSLELHRGALFRSAVKGSAIVGLVGVVAAVWNIWHTLMQKFGIMRVYAAKSSVPVEARTPPWADRFLIFGTLPLLALWVGPAQRDVIASQAKSVTAYVLPAVDVIANVQPYAMPPAIAIALASIVTFLWFEKRAGGLHFAPRLAMAVGLTGLSAAFFFVNPLKVYLAYGFSHAVEYMVFVWAFLRRRYAVPQPHRPFMQRALTRPWLAYGLFTLPIAATFLFIEFGDDYGLHRGKLRLFDQRVGIWLFCFAIWQSLAHFYFDGFLWKTRKASMRASL